MDFSYLDKNVSSVREKIDNAKKRCNAEFDCDVTLLAAVKYATPEEIDYIHKNLNINDIGENRVQQLLEHWEKIDHEGINLHFIGSLQTNKVKYIIDKVCMIHSLDSEKLAYEIDRQAKKAGRVMDVLTEVNSGEESSKGGVMPSDVEDFCAEIKKYENINLRGFMTMAPKGCTSEEYMSYFGKTRRMCDAIWKDVLGREDKAVYSMGMSSSFEEAIISGATIVRVGSNIFTKIQ